MKINILVLGALLYLVMMAATVSIVYFLGSNEKSDPDSRTKELCRQYADRNHDGELAPSRVQWFADQGIDINRDFDWYQSCIDHNTTPVAR